MEDEEARGKEDEGIKRMEEKKEVGEGGGAGMLRSTHVNLYPPSHTHCSHTFSSTQHI